MTNPEPEGYLHTPIGIFGAVEIGVLLSTMLYGMTLVQTYIYALNSSKDPRSFKIIVYSILSVNMPEVHLRCSELIRRL
jgi:hypothetical protein